MAILSLYISDTKIMASWIKPAKPKIEVLKKYEISRDIACHEINKAIFKDFSHADKIVLCLPRRQISFKHIVIPAKDKSEIDQMLPFELSGIIPYKIEECCYDWLVEEITPEGYSKILVIVGRKKIINEYLDVCRSIGARPAVINVSTLALFESFKNWARFHPEIKEKENIILQIHDNSADMIAVKGMQIVFSREFMFKDNEELVSELDKNLQVGQIMNKDFTPKVFILNVPQNLSDMAGVLKDRFKIDVDINDAIDINTGIGYEAKMINLLPEEEVKIRYIRHLKQGIYLAGVLLFMIIFLISSVWFIRFKKIKWDIEKIKKSLNSLGISAKELELKKQRIALISQQKGIYPQVILEGLAELASLTPDGVTFSSFVIDENKNIILRGEVREYDKFLNLVSLLEKSVYFKDVEVKNTSRRQLPSEIITNFEVGAKLNK